MWLWKALGFIGSLYITYHICSWAGLSPGNNESAEKKVHSHHPRQHLSKTDPLRSRLVHHPGYFLLDLALLSFGFVCNSRIRLDFLSQLKKAAAVTIPTPGMLVR